MSMYAKLALSMVAAGTLALLALALALDWRLGRGFVAYINDADAERLAPLALAAAEVWRRDGGWDGLRARPERVAWRALHARVRALEDAAESGQVALSPAPPSRQPRARRQRPPGHGHGHEGGPPWTPLWARVAIHEPDGTPVLGRHAFERTGRRLAIEVDGRQVGWVGLVELERASGRLGQAFLADQRRGLVVAALVLLVALALAAMALARAWAGPVRRVGGGALSRRVGPRGRDEIGVLARDVDLLGQSLAAADAARRRWMADAAHELRTPLSVLKGELEALLDGVRPLDASAIASLHAEATHLGALINELRELALADLGALDYRMAEVALDALVDECLAANAGRLAQHGLAVEWMRPPQAVRVHGDARRLRQLVENLLENSLRYTDRGGRIAVALATGPAGVRLDWQDSAPGVPEAMLGQLFEPFVRGDPARGRDEAGGGGGCRLGRARARSPAAGAVPAWAWRSCAASSRRTAAASSPLPRRSVAWPCASTCRTPRRRHEHDAGTGDHPGGRGRTQAGPPAGRLPARRRLRTGHRRARRPGAGRRRRAPAGADAARPQPARHGRHRGLPRVAPALRPAGGDGHRAGRGESTGGSAWSWAPTTTSASRSARAR